MESKKITEIRNIKLPENLPDPISKVFWDFYNKVYEIKEEDNERYERYVAWIGIVLPAFENIEMIKFWEKILKKDSRKIKSDINLNAEERAQKVAECLLNMGNCISDIYNVIDQTKEHLKKSAKELKKLKRLHKNSKEIKNQELFINENSISLHIRAYELYMQGLNRMAENENFQSNFTPITRQSKGIGKATLHANFICTIFKKLYGKPMYSEVTFLINLFKQSYEKKSQPYGKNEIKSKIARCQKSIKLLPIRFPIQELLEFRLESKIIPTLWPQTKVTQPTKNIC